MDLAGTSDEILLTRLRAGCEDSFSTLYRRHQGRIFRFAFAMSGSETIAEEVTQEVFLALIGPACSFDRSRGSVAAFLLGMTRNYVLRHLRQNGRYAPLPEGAGETVDPGFALAGVTRQETIEAVRRAVLSLPLPYREAVALCDLEEMDYSEVAASLDCPVGTVRSRLHRGRALLAEKLADFAGVETSPRLS
jgi:RNA polymerase sigma-70 factor (ECF subfamily)